MLIVSDTSPITNLIQIGKLDILKQLFERIIIPRKVFEELMHYENQKNEIEKRDWIIVNDVFDTQKVKVFEAYLDSGEAEAIVLAKELGANMLIVDERKGRKFAEEYGLKIIGLLGVLIQAKRQGSIKRLKPILDDLINKVGFRVSIALYQRILNEIEE